MDSLNESLKEGVSIEEEVFFGPITDRERKVKEQFENAFNNENKMSGSHLVVENDMSKNDSLYKSFSITESKYDSFDDSLNEELDQHAQETKHITLRKSFDKLKSKKPGFYDSLEDVCSLVSNMDKCSISCEVENHSNLNNKQHIIEDSLKNPSMAVVNKSSGVNDQVHFDDDSLAILELENTFDDSLEEINDVYVLSSIEFEEVDDIKNMTVENQNIAIKVEQNTPCIPRNLFDTSVQIVYEKKWMSDQESSDDKNMLYDSLSNSDFKDVLKDSLEESEKCSENLNFLKHIPGKTDTETKKSERMFGNKNEVEALVHNMHEHFQIGCQIESSTCEINNSEINEFSKNSFKNYKNVNNVPVRQRDTKTSKDNDSHSFNANAVFFNESTAAQKFSEGISTNAGDNAVYLDSKVNRDQLMENAAVITKPVIPVSNIEHSNRKEAFTVDSCQLKNIKDIGNDLKFQLNIEVTVEDKECQIASQEVKVLPAAGVQSEKCEKDFLTAIPVEYHSEDHAYVKDDLNISNSKLKSNTGESNTIEDIVCNEATSTKNVCENSEIINATNITLRTKSCGSKLFSNSEQKFNFPENVSNISLLQALDLHDISESFFDESFIQSNDSLLPLNLCCKDQDVCTSVARDECKENVPQPLIKKKHFSTSSTKASPSSIHISKTPKHFQNSPSLKDPSKKTLGTKIPVRKIENFAVPISTLNRQVKQVATAMSAEKIKKCQHSPHSAGKKTPGTTPIKTPHFCKVRNTIFSKVPQIVPSKKYMNIQSPVAQYIKNIHGSGKTPRFDPVLRDCMNQQLESPFHSQQTPKSGTLKSTKKKF